MRSVYVVVLAVAAVFGCSSVPDVVFVDDDAGATDPGDVVMGEDSGIGDGSQDSGVEEDSGTPEPDPGYRCPDAPPPADEGVCCGTQLCLRCTESDCDRCVSADCTGRDVCCAVRRGGSSRTSVECRSQRACEP